MNNTPNTKQNSPASPANEWQELLQTPEVMSSSDSPSSRDIPTPADYPWEIDSSSMSSSSSKVSITWITPEPEEVHEEGESYLDPINTSFETEIYENKSKKQWCVRLLKAEGKSIIRIFTKGFRHADSNPPVNETEAVEAVNIMNNYRLTGKGSWHTLTASRIHENYHRTQWMDASNFYWEDSEIQQTVEGVNYPSEIYEEKEAALLIKNRVDKIRDNFNNLVRAYIHLLPDMPGDGQSRAFRAGQFELNRVTARIQDEAKRKNWTKVSQILADVGDTSKPCHVAPVSQMYGGTRNKLMNVPPLVPEENTTQNIQLNLANLQDIQSNPLLVAFCNNGTETARLLDKFTPDLIRHAFFDIILTDKQGKKLFHSLAGAMIAFQANLKYLDIQPGTSRNVSVPLHDLIREQCPESLPAGEYTLSVIYHNKYGEDCIKGNLQITENVLIE